MNSVKRHICDVKNLELGQKPSQKFPNLQYLVVYKGPDKKPCTHDELSPHCKIFSEVYSETKSTTIWASKGQKPFFWASEKARLKPVSSATETSLKIEISLVAS